MENPLLATAFFLGFACLFLAVTVFVLIHYLKESLCHIADTENEMRHYKSLYEKSVLSASTVKKSKQRNKNGCD